MFVSGRPIMLLLFRLFGSVTSLSIPTRAPPLRPQISPPSPFPSALPSLPSSLGAPPPTSTPLISSTAGSPDGAACSLTTSPSALVVRFGDPVTANCSVTNMVFSLLGWEVSLASPPATMERFVVWSVDRMTEWSIMPMCYILLERGGQCHIGLPVTVYKPPDNVSISFDDHCGPLLEGRQYTLQCHVQNVAPVGHLNVTFYKGRTPLGQRQSNKTEKTPLTAIFAMDIVPSKEDDGAQYWCEARLDLGPAGPQRPPVVTSQKLNVSVLFGPHFACPAKLQVKEGERLICDVRGNPQPLVTWFRDGREVALPIRSGRRHAGKYTAWTQGHLGQKNFTLEVEVVANSGTSNSWNRCFLTALVCIQMINWM